MYAKAKYEQLYQVRVRFSRHIQQQQQQNQQEQNEQKDCHLRLFMSRNPQNVDIFIKNDYQLLSYVSSGTYGNVFKAINTQNKEHLRN